MCRFVCFFLLTSAWGQTTPVSPTVRDAFVRRGNPRVVSLTDYLNVVVCKSEYDAWQGDQKSVPALSLYMNGVLMKGPEAARPIPGTAGEPSDARAEKVNADCVKQADEAVSAAEKESADKAAAKGTGDPRYVMQYYLDPQFVTEPDTKEPWIRLLAGQGPVTVSVGPADGSPWTSEAVIPFERIHRLWLAGWIALFGLAIILFVKYAGNSDIIRDAGVLAPPAEGDVAQRKAYSLARTQMALWTFLVAGALAFLFMVTWNENTLSNGILILLGISYGTTLLAKTAEGPPKPKSSKGFFSDLLSDDDGPSFHRYQMVLFTMILAAIFVVKAISNLIMPDFDPALLGLMGISSGTYLGSKLQGR